MLACVLIMAALKLSAQNGPSTFEFIENKGQWDNSIQFRGQLSSAEFYLQKKGFLIALHNPVDMVAATSHGRGADASAKRISYKPDLSGKVTDHSISPVSTGVVIHSHAYAVEFVGANENAQIVPDKVQPYFNNYFIGNDHSKWASKVKIFGAVLYKNIYPNIDVRYSSESGQLKYDLIVHPGGDPSKVVMKYTGADKLSLKNNDLIIKTSVGDVKELYPYSFQTDNVKGKTEVACKYVVSGSTVRFQLADFSKTSTLIIDPSLIFASFTGSTSDQWGFTATPGPDGSLFSGGIVFGQGFPVTTGAYQSTFAGGNSTRTGGVDIGIMKFSPNGSARLYATYIGGSGNDYPHSLISDAQGNLVVMGRTTSSADPTPAGYPGTVVGSAENGSIVVTKLNVDGSKLIGSLIIGGEEADGLNIADLEEVGNTGDRSLIRNYGDDSRSEVTMDGAGNVYVAAQTFSKQFPILGGGFQNRIGGNQDGVVMKINPSCTAVLWSTYLGGSEDDGAFVIDISPTNGNVYVGGGTTTQSGFPGMAAGVLHQNYQGGSVDGYIAEISADGKTLISSSYLGTTGDDVVYGLKFDKLGFPYVMGVSRGGLWPVQNAAYSVAGSSQFVAKIKPDLSGFVYSTVFGSGSPKPNMSPVAFLVDRCENVYISGWGGWISTEPGSVDPYNQAGVVGMPITPDAIKPTTDNKDFYFIVIQKNSSKLLYGTFFGQDGGAYGEHVDGGTSRYDKQGVIYQAICANCAGGARFPTTPGVIGPVNGALPKHCNLAGVKISFNFAGVAAGPESFVDGIHDSVGCAPFTVTLRDTVRNAVSYIWQFGDGSPDSATKNFELNHTYNNIGTYKVALIAIDSNSCNVSDTAYTYIRVGNVKANVQLAFAKQGDCLSSEYKFDNLSTSDNPSINFHPDSSFIWTFGDSTDPVYAGTGSQTHAYPGPGIYPVTLTLTDTNFCNSPLTLDTVVRVNPLVKAQFETPASGCAPYNAVFNNTSLAGQTFDWDFGDGSTSQQANPTHLYPTPGTYIIKLVARDETTCNKISDTSITIIVASKPTSLFSYSPVAPIQNKPNIFTNLSTGGVRFNWLFGDGTGLIKTNMDTATHQYNASGPYQPCLVAINEFGCTDTSCQNLVAEILPLLDVPTAFTPGKFGKNALIYVQGFGIAQMSWKIYNRFGQKVFETNSNAVPWDGTFNGKLQPMDVYTYTLDATLSDGKKVRKTGDITLIR